ncbi:MAG: hypothetical protein IPM45_03325 [Acidimicrobiales bacterium]|nr:hypothetical protein [Acidimicrobiales bacterium]
MLDPDALEPRLRAVAARGSFEPTGLADLPEPARRYLLHALAPGTPLAGGAELRMHGTIKLGPWVPFRATEVLVPGSGFVWRADAGLLLGPLALGIRGFDAADAAEGRMHWAVAGLVPVVRAGGPDVARSARGRAAGEALLVPTALHPAWGVTWRADGADHAVASVPMGPDTVDVHLELDATGRVRRSWFDRWGNPGGGAHRVEVCGMEVLAERTFGGVTVPSAGRIGWFFGTDRWAEGEFFRMSLDQVCLLDGGA